jgi:hypothetical protein
MEGNQNDARVDNQSEVVCHVEFRILEGDCLIIRLLSSSTISFFVSLGFSVALGCRNISWKGLRCEKVFLGEAVDWRNEFEVAFPVRYQELDDPEHWILVHIPLLPVFQFIFCLMLAMPLNVRGRCMTALPSLLIKRCKVCKKLCCSLGIDSISLPFFVTEKNLLEPR